MADPGRGARTSESAPLGECVCCPGSRGGGHGGAAHHFLHIYYSPYPRPCGDVYSWATSAGWQATCILLECLESPRSQENGAHSLGPAFLLCSRGELWQLTCNLSPPTIQLPARYLPQTSHLKSLGSLGSLLHPVLQELLCPLPFVFLSLLLNHSSPCLFLYKSIPDL